MLLRVHADPSEKALREKYSGLTGENAQVPGDQSTCQGRTGPGTAPHAVGRPARRKRAEAWPRGPQGPGQPRGDAGRSARRGANARAGPRSHAPSWAWTREWEGDPAGRAASGGRKKTEGRRVSGPSRARPAGRPPYLLPAGPPLRPPPPQVLQRLAPRAAGPSRRQSCERAPRDFLHACPAAARPRHAHSGPPRPSPPWPRPVSPRPSHAAEGRAGGAVQARARSPASAAAPRAFSAGALAHSSAPTCPLSGTHPLVHSPAPRSSAYSRPRSSAHSGACSFICSLTHPVIQSLAHLPLHPLARLLKSPDCRLEARQPLCWVLRIQSCIRYFPIWRTDGPPEWSKCPDCQNQNKAAGAPHQRVPAALPG